MERSGKARASNRKVSGTLPFEKRTQEGGCMTDDQKNIIAAEYIIQKLNERDDEKRRIKIVERIYAAVVDILLTVFVLGFDWYDFKLAAVKWWAHWS
jgi:hypothetical protein